MPKQGDLFGPIRSTGQPESKENQILFEIEVDGLIQPFQMLVFPPSRLAELEELGRVAYIDSGIWRGPKGTQPTLPTMGWYRFLCLRERGPGGLLIQTHVDGTVDEPQRYRLPFFSEGLGLVRQFPNFKSTQPIWVLNATFLSRRSTLGLTLVMTRGPNGWRLDLQSSAAGMIYPNHLILVHRNMR